MAAAAAIRCPVQRHVMPKDFAPHWPPLVPSLVHPGTAIRPTSPHRWAGPLSRHAAGG
ncbi:MAG: hypothetical protein V3U93_01485 [Alphaproteobacteria bacterium]